MIKTRKKAEKHINIDSRNLTNLNTKSTLGNIFPSLSLQTSSRTGQKRCPRRHRREKGKEKEGSGRQEKEKKRKRKEERGDKKSERASERERNERKM